MVCKLGLNCFVAGGLEEGVVVGVESFKRSVLVGVKSKKVQAIPIVAL